MPQSAYQFDFSEPSEPLVLSAARQLADFLSSGAMLTRRDISDTLSEQFGGSDADGRWSLTEAHAALELAQVLWLMGQSELTVTTRVPSRLSSAETTASVCPARVSSNSPLSASHTRAVPSSLAVTTRAPSGENWALMTPPSYLSSTAIVTPLAASQTRAVPSKLAVTTRFPSGENWALMI